MNHPINKFWQHINRKVELKIPVWVFIIVPAALYGGWEYYWFRRVGWAFIKWHTHVMVHACWFGVIVLPVFLIVRTVWADIAEKAVLILASVAATLMLLEGVLHFTGYNQTYLEKINGHYTSHYQPNNRTHYFSWDPGQPHQLVKPEFSYWRPTNSHGLPDGEWSLGKQPGEIRILAMGDSFTEGDGAPYDSTFVSLLQGKLLKAGHPVYMMNGGMCGSDPFYNYIFLKDKLLPYHPDAVIQTIGTNDLSDMLIRGGMERFAKDGTLKYSDPPWWEPVYAVSYASRIFFKAAGYNELLIRDRYSNETVEKLNRLLIDLFREYAALCRERDISLMVVLRPDRQELINQQYGFDFSVIQNELRSLGITMIDLIPGFAAYIEKSNTRPEYYYWKEDSHHNSRGYEIMAQVIYESIMPLLTSLERHQDRRLTGNDEGTTSK